MSVDKNFEQAPPHKYRSSKKVVELLSQEHDLILVHPGDFHPQEAAVSRSFRYLEPGKLEIIPRKHLPEGDLFIVYGDETSKNPGLDFGRQFYSSLRNLRRQERFPYFLNDPDAEEATLKDYLAELYEQGDFSVAATFHYLNKENSQRLLEKHGQLVFKPIFGCGSAGVHKISSLDELDELDRLGSEEEVRKNYAIQELLNGSEIRVIILGGEFLCSREDINYHPWSDRKTLMTKVGNPTAFQIDTSQRIAQRLKADLVGVDFIGDKVYEINGTGTGLIAYDENCRLLFDRTPEFVDYVNRILKK